MDILPSNSGKLGQIAINAILVPPVCQHRSFFISIFVRGFRIRYSLTFSIILVLLVVLWLMVVGFVFTVRIFDCGSEVPSISHLVQTGLNINIYVSTY